MATVTLDPSGKKQNPPEVDLHECLTRQRNAFQREGAPSLAHRREALNKIHRLLINYRQDIIEAISRDFGNRSQHESLLAELFITINAIKHSRKKLKKWMKPKRAPIAWQFKPGTGKVHYQPLGVVGIISPWNYPLQLAIVPIVQALSAGNRVMLKPSEVTPATSALLAKMLSESFSPDEVAVVNGGPEVGAAFSALPFDHLFYTGSTNVGRLVMMAAAKNLVPVTLELGGKSPCILADDYPIDKAVGSIIAGKLLNAGQTCVAPDYTFVPKTKLDAFVEAAQRQVEKMYPTLAANEHYTAIVSEGHYNRVQHLLEDARAKGARVLEFNPAEEDLSQTRKIPPTLVLDVTDEMDIMREEIFAPVMPILTYDKEQEAIDYVNANPRPLALYYFGHDATRIKHMVSSTISGGVCVNDTLFHLAQEELPFGGVGPSGLGSYHGTYGFKTFSHEKAVFYQSRFAASGIFRAPYGKLFDTIVNFLIGK